MKHDVVAPIFLFNAYLLFSSFFVIYFLFTFAYVDVDKIETIERLLNLLQEINKANACTFHLERKSQTIIVSIAKHIKLMRAIRSHAFSSSGSFSDTLNDTMIFFLVF